MLTIILLEIILRMSCGVPWGFVASGAFTVGFTHHTSKLALETGHLDIPLALALSVLARPTPPRRLVRDFARTVAGRCSALLPHGER